MKPPRPRTARPRAIDPALIGTWAGGDSLIGIDAEGWEFALDQTPGTITPDGQTLTTIDTVYTRTFGSGLDIAGAWQLTFEADNAIWVDDWYFRSDGSYTYQFTRNGVFHSVYFGQYTHQNGILTTQERRALITTGPDNAIHLEVPFGEDDTGTYSLPDENTQVRTFRGVSHTLTRV